jgi:hypothetical protein
VERVQLPRGVEAGPQVDYDAGHGGMGGLTTRQVDALRADELGFDLWQTGDPVFSQSVEL